LAARSSLRDARRRQELPSEPRPATSRSQPPPIPSQRQARLLPRSSPPQAEALAARIKQWRADEAKRLKVPAYVVLHDRTLTALAQVRPRNPRQLLEIDGMGPAKVERFGEAILRLCAQE
jgi:superfamily II DNA helicase RecQ